MSARSHENRFFFFFLCVWIRVAAAVMKQAHLEGVATHENAIAAIEKDLRAFGDDTDQDGHGRHGEEEEDDTQVRRQNLWKTAHIVEIMI